MTILVTGGTGLIGCHCAATLRQSGQDVRLFVRDVSKLARVLAPFGLDASDFEIATGSISDQDSVARALSGCDGLLHCAGIFSPDRSDESKLRLTNIEGTRNVLEAAAASGIRRAVYVSSMLALFPPRGEEMTAEDPVTEPVSMYAATKAEAERIARSFQEERAEGEMEGAGGVAGAEGEGATSGMRLSIVYPAAVQGPDDPTFSIGPQLVAAAIESGTVLVTDGGLATTDVRDLARVIEALFDATSEPPRRLMAPSFYVTHERYRALLERISGRPIKARRIPGRVLRWMGHVGDWMGRLGRPVQLTYEAAEVLTRSVPLDDRPARAMLSGPALTDEQSFRDLIDWMKDAGHLDLGATDSSENR